MKKIIFIFLFVVTGCVSTTIEPKVEATKSWEGHFKTVAEFRKATENMTLDENDSVWVLHNRTLSRVLKNVGEK